GRVIRKSASKRSGRGFGIVCSPESLRSGLGVRFLGGLFRRLAIGKEGSRVPRPAALQIKWRCLQVPPDLREELEPLAPRHPEVRARIWDFPTSVRRSSWSLVCNHCSGEEPSKGDDERISDIAVVVVVAEVRTGGADLFNRRLQRGIKRDEQACLGL